MRVALAQINPTVGDLTGNAGKIARAYDEAVAAGAHLVAFPELTVTGYPPEDLLLKPTFVAQAAEEVEKLAARTGSTVAVIGFPQPGPERPFNAAAVCRDGGVVGVYRKQVLPNYAVFDEERYFATGDDLGPFFEVEGVTVAVSVCEDIWRPDGPPTRQAREGAQLVVNINASPYHRGRQGEREAMLAQRVGVGGAAIAYVNTVGGQDELVFDGGSVLMTAGGQVLARAPQFEEAVVVADLDAGPGDVHEPMGEEEEVYSALVLGTRDYVGKNGFTDVLLGLSGGIDSALVAAVAADALGPEHVTGLLMPSRYSSEGSVTDARRLAENLGIRTHTIPIEPAFAAFLSMLEEPFEGRAPDVAEENLQARIRGVIAMAMSNKFGSMVLTTGNKSEMAAGYATLYGDMAGGYAVVKDVFKTLVFRLCRWRNERAGTDLIPRAIIDKAPSAELREGQLDTDSLPPYDELDPILEAYIERALSSREIIAEGHDPDLVRRMIRLVDRNEYKRRQAPPGVRISPLGFGKDRRLPITNRWTP